MSNFRSDKLPAQLLAWLQANPDEELTYPDIMARWGVAYQTAANAVYVLKAHGIESVHVVRLRVKGWM